MNLLQFYAFLLILAFIIGGLSAFHKDRKERRREARLQKMGSRATIGDDPTCAGTPGTSAGVEGKT